MIRFKRVIALILATALLASGIPMSFAAAEESPVAEEPAIRFQQNGFDEETSILTMTLQVKGTPGKYLKEGMFAFRVDTDVLIPMTNPVTGEGESALSGRADKVGYIMSGAGARPNDVQLFIQQRGVDVGGGLDFNAVMNTHRYDNSSEGGLGAGDFHTTYTGYFLSGQRASAEQNGLLDCYFQYLFSAPPELTDEYVDVMDFKFLCISGYDKDGPVKAGNTNSLLSGAIVLPKDETEEKAILEQFSYTDNSGATKLLALGAAGFREKASASPVAQDTKTVNYYAVPQSTDWRPQKWNGLAVESDNRIGTPGLDYPNMDVKYLVKSFYADCNNTYTYKGDTTGTGNDFYIPDNESKNVQIPRYAVPEAPEDEANDEAGRTDPAAWIPRAYTGRGAAKEKKVPLKYMLGTGVLESSQTTPEMELGIVEFMSRVTWDFAIDDKGTLLSSLNYSLEGEPWTEDGKTVQYATLHDERYPEYEGYQVQVTTGDGETLVSPIGVTYDLLDTQISWNGPPVDGQSPTDIAPAPQLNVKSKAALNKSYLWQERKNETGRVFLVGTYHDESSGQIFTQKNPVEIKLYKNESVATSVDLNLNEVGTVVDNGDTVLGFQVGKGRNGIPDVDVGADGVAVSSYVYDQYGLEIYEKASSLTIEPSAETGEAIEANGKKNAFTITSVAGQPGQYLIKYGVDVEDNNDPFTVNDVFDGNYVISASYREGIIELEADMPESERTIRIVKEPDELAFMQVSTDKFETPMEGDPTEPEIEIRSARIPTASEKDITLKMVPTELSNQWRDVNDLTQIQKVSEYDIVPDLRDENGTMNLDLIYQNTSLDVAYEFAIAGDSAAASPKGLDISKVSRGEIGVSYKVPDNTRILYTIKVWYKKNRENNPPDQVKTYKIILQRDPITLKRIEMLKVNNNTNYIKVPDYYDDGSEPETVHLSANPFTQYNDQITWDMLEILYQKHTVQNPYDEDFTAKMNIKGGIDSLPAGVTFDENTWDLTVAPGVPSCDVVVFASFGNSYSHHDSAEMTIRVRRADSIPKELYIEYPNRNKVTPSTKAQGTPKKITPTVEMTDQYQTDMDSDYRIEWSITSADYMDEVSIDKDTGEITVASCAHNGTISLRLLVYDKNNNYCFKKTYTDIITIDRGAISTTGAEITTKRIEYRQDTALGLNVTTQYGEVGEVDSVLWELLSVTTAGGESFTAENGGIKVTSSDASGGTVTLTKGGSLSFAQVLDMNPDNAPEKVKVRVTINSTLSVEEEIEIWRDVNQIPKDIYIPTEIYSKQVRVPDLGSPPSTRTLTATVRDKYGLKVEESAVTWSWGWEDKPDDVEFVEGSIDIKGGNVLTVTREAPAAVITVTAKYSETLSRTEAILVSADEANPSSVVISELQSGVIEGKNKVPLPGKNSSGDTYQLTAKVLDQRGLRMPGKTVTWSIESGAASVESATGKLTIKFDQSVCDSSTGKGDIVVKATTVNNENTPVEQSMTITVLKQSPVATFAIPELDLDNPGTDFSENLVQIPEKGEPENEAIVKATVYSQYHEEMPGEKAEFAQVEPVMGLAFLDNQDGTASLTLSSVVPGQYTEVVAKPRGMQGAAQDMDKENNRLCKVRVNFKRAVSYAYRLTKGQMNQVTGKVEPDDTFAPVPNWVSQADSFVPSSPAKPAEYTFGAEILDQYDGKYSIDESVSVKWEFEEDYPDVEFKGAASDGTFTGKTATILVGNQAIERTETDKIVRVHLTAVGVDIDWGNPEEAARFQETLEVELKKNVSKESYLYVDGSTEMGIAEEALVRPYQEESKKYPDKPFKTNTRTISATVYDQYGFAVPEAERTVSLVEESVTEQGMTVETRYKAGESAENGNIPQQYIVKNEKKETIAEYDTETGLLTVNYTSTLTEIRFLAESKELGITKEFTLPIDIEEPEETSVKVVRETPKTYTIRSTSADNMAEHVHAEVYDQYGAKMLSPTEVETHWELQMLDKEGKLVKYVDYGDDGLEKLPSKYLMQLQSGSLKDANITVLPAEFKTDQTVYLTCELYNLSGSSLFPKILNTVPIYVKKYRESVAPPSYFVVSYEAGEHGTLVGGSSETVFGGSGVAAAPDIDSEDGYAFKGWSENGEDVVNLSNYIVSDNVTFTALYHHVEDGKFLNGYEDGTVRPNRKISRAEFVTLLVNVVGGYDPATYYGISFKDVTVDKWYANMVAYAKIKGFVSGYEDGTFHPNANITRAEAATMIMMAKKLSPMNPGNPTFSDVPKDEWYYGYIEALAYEKIISGYADGTFHPESNITRAEAVTMLVPISQYPLTEEDAERIKKYGDSPFKDLEINWAYAYILRAAGVA